MVIALVTLLLLVCLAIVVYPLLNQDVVGQEQETAETVAEGLRRERDRLYEEIRVLQQEYFLHDVTEEAYHARLQAARYRAALLIRQEQQLDTAIQDIGAAIEEEVQASLQSSDPHPEERS